MLSRVSVLLYSIRNIVQLVYQSNRVINSDTVNLITKKQGGNERLLISMYTVNYKMNEGYIKFVCIDSKLVPYLV